MHSFSKLFSLFLIAGIISFVSCQKEETTIPLNDSAEISDAEQVDLDLKNGEPKDTTTTKKGNKEYCQALKEKMSKLDKNSKDMEACMKLYKYKCGDCKHDKTDKDSKSYCADLKAKLAKTKKGSKEYDSLMSLIKEKCSKEDKKGDSYCSELKAKLAKTKKGSKEYDSIWKLLKEKC